MKLTEKILTGLWILGLIFKFALLPGGSVIFLLGIQLLSILYFIFSFLLFNNIRFRSMFKGESYAHTNTMRIIGAVCSGLCLSVLLTGILFKFLLWPGAMPMLIVGLVPSGIILVIAFVKYLTTKNRYYAGVLVRVGVYLLLSMILCAVSNLSLVKIYHRDNPAYIDAYEQLQLDPGNPELERQLELEENRGYMSPEQFKDFEESIKKENAQLHEHEKQAPPAPVQRKFPFSEGWTNDFAHILKPEEVKDLNGIITAYTFKSKISIHLVTVDSVEKYDTSDVAGYDLIEEWSSSEDEKVVLVLVSMSKREATICADEETERILTEDIRQRILASSLVPEFKKSRYYSGLKSSLLQIIKILDSRPGKN
jgi:hypothetical protein